MVLDTSVDTRWRLIYRSGFKNQLENPTFGAG
jgi:hypothetical protein